MSRYATGKLLLLGIVLLVAEATLLDAWSLGGGKAELLLALACFAALFARDSRQGLAAAWFVGLLKDAGSSCPLGLHALLFLAAAWGVLQARQILFRDFALTQLGVAFVAACWVNLAVALFTSATAGRVPLSTLLGKTFGSALLTAALTPVLLLALRQSRWLVR